MYKSQLRKRVESFLWRLAMVTIAFVVSWLSENIGFLELPPQVTLVLGLILGELSKYLNNRRLY